MFANALLRRRAGGLCFRLLVHANTGLVEAFRSVVAPGVTTFATERIIGGNFGSTLGTIHDASVPYQNFFAPAPSGESP